jgi:proteasome lid subunit RPN8/RPN11
VRTTLALTEETWSEIVSALEEPRETAGFLLAAFARGADALTLLGRTLRWVAEEGYLVRTATRLTITSAGFVPSLAAAAKDKSVPVFVHTHPGGDPMPSARDAKVDRQLRGPALIRSRQPFYVSLIVGGTRRKPRFTGIVYGPEGKIAELERIRVIGKRIHIIGAADHAASTINFDAFDRQIRAFGKDGQRLIARLRVGVAGAGGTGSAVFEQLVRLGVREIVVIDDDTLSNTNLPRIHESARSQCGELKVDVAKQAAERIGLGADVRAVEGRISDKAIARELKHCDVVFGCTDDETGRQQLSKLALWYLIPVFRHGLPPRSDAEGRHRRPLRPRHDRRPRRGLPRLPRLRDTRRPPRRVAAPRRARSPSTGGLRARTARARPVRGRLHHDGRHLRDQRAARQAHRLRRRTRRRLHRNPDPPPRAEARLQLEAAAVRPLVR